MPYSFSAKANALAEVQTTPPPDGDEAPAAVKRQAICPGGWIGGEA